MEASKIRLAFLVMLCALTTGCSIFPTNFGKLEGRFWCNQRYLDMVNEYQDPIGSNLHRKINLAKQGYVYSTAAVLTLQKDGVDPDFHFAKPSYLTEIPELNADEFNGFQASTYIKTGPDEGSRKEIIIAFRGSDQWRDWIWQNFGLALPQHKSAREYVQRVRAHPATQGLPLIATGYSLGGGLASHVAQHPETKALIDQAWLFNPSPRNNTFTELQDNIFLLAAQNEMLNKTDRKKLGAKLDNTETSYNLVKSSSIYAHYRWVLQRHLLMYADLGYLIDSNRTLPTSPAQKILESQDAKACSAKTSHEIAAERTEYNKRRETITFDNPDQNTRI